MSKKSPIHILNPEVARKIAAGEVIDRPNAIVRELMDNAIDSQADSITVEIYGGGIEKIRVADNGSGMTKEDLQTCAKPHATSKISTETDLLNLKTLGFRGEALASIAAVSRLSINSGGNLLRASITEDHIITPTTPLEGTIVCSEGLFENFPARRVFLKRPASEATLCKNMFVEKAIPNPEKSFRFINEGSIRLDLPKAQDLIHRFVKAMEINSSPELFSMIHGESLGNDKDWSFDVVIGEPGIYRSNKKDILIFVNGRKIQEYSLVQAVEYGAQGFFPNGTFPVAAVFIKMNPSLVDFNIHPAKREVRFKDSSALHHGISSAIKNHFSEWTNKTMKFNSEKMAKKLIQSELTEMSESAFDSTLQAQSTHSTFIDKKNTYQTNEIKDENIYEKRNFSREYFFEPLDKNTSWHSFSEIGTKSHIWKPENTQSVSDNNGKNYNSDGTPNLKNNLSQESSKLEVEKFMNTVLEAFNKQDIENIPNYFQEKQLKENLGTDFNIDSKNTFQNKNLGSNFFEQNENNEVISQIQDLESKDNKQFFSVQENEKKSIYWKTDFQSEKNENHSLSSIQMAAKAMDIFASKKESPFHFLGSALGTFLIAEKDDILYIIDKHAANERFLFDKIMENQGERQKLLIPYTFETSSDDQDAYLESIKDDLDHIGFSCQNKGNGKWEISTINLRWTGTQDELINALLEEKNSPKDIIYSIAAMTACKAAVKDGWILEDCDAEQIAKDALSLKDPHCPHGRPVYTTITREELFKLVRRT